MLTSFDDAAGVMPTQVNIRRDSSAAGYAWTIGGFGLLALVYLARLDRELYLLGAGLTLYGLALIYLHFARSRNAFTEIMQDLHEMPHPMRRLALVQFFSWFALFAMWIYTTSAVTSVHFGAIDTQSSRYNEGANWVGVLFAAYNGFAALAAVIIPIMVRHFGLRISHLINVWLGCAGLVSFLVIRDPQWLLLSMVGVGFAWASILSLPYALLSDSLPARKMGVYMGIFNFFIVIPQLLAASVLGFLLRTLLNNAPLYALGVGGLSLFVAGLCVLRVDEPRAEPASEPALAVTK
jgi:maltose/moltooligosaccharide transporter